MVENLHPTTDDVKPKFPRRGSGEAGVARLDLVDEAFKVALRTIRTVRLRIEAHEQRKRFLSEPVKRGAALRAVRRPPPVAVNNNRAPFLTQNEVAAFHG